jgi:type IV pilus assembly protein PilE
MTDMNTFAHATSPRRYEQLRSRMRGMTLLELMAVIMVIGVLGVIAIPSYRQYVMRAHRAEAKSALLQLQTNQERYYLANRTYGTVAQLVTANLLNSGGLSERGTYAITLTGVSATGYLATASPASGGAFDMSADAQCTTFTINAQGVRGATGTTAATCW